MSELFEVILEDYLERWLKNMPMTDNKALHRDDNFCLEGTL